MFILASASPTRARILKKHNIDFIQKATQADEETINTKIPKQFVYLATKLKMKHAIKEFDTKQDILCADTVVSTNNKILRKASNIDEAREILKLQSDNLTSITTCMIFKSKKLELIDISSTIYEFSKFDEAELEKFLKSNEWKGKAGACMVEGFCKAYIKSVRGHESCAMGLTIEKLKPFL